MNYVTSEGADLEERLEALKRDITDKTGPRISIMKNFPYALFHYRPEDEYRMRRALQGLINSLRNTGWKVLNVSLIDVFLKMIKESGYLPDFIEAERAIYESSNRDIESALRSLDNRLATFFDINNPEGFAQHVVNEINSLATDEDSKSIVFLTRAGALYPFYRVSILLKYIDGKATIPVILLYPGIRKAHNTLSFMGELDASTDYRPRIY